MVTTGAETVAVAVAAAVASLALRRSRLPTRTSDPAALPARPTPSCGVRGPYGPAHMGRIWIHMGPYGPI